VTAADATLDQAPSTMLAMSALNRYPDSYGIRALDSSQVSTIWSLTGPGADCPAKRPGSGSEYPAGQVRLAEESEFRSRLRGATCHDWLARWAAALVQPDSVCPGRQAAPSGSRRDEGRPSERQERSRVD